MDFKQTTDPEEQSDNDLMSVNSLFTENPEEDLEPEEEETLIKKSEPVPPIPTGSIPFTALKRRTFYKYAIKERGVNKMITGELITKITSSPSTGMRLKIARQYKNEVKPEILDVIAVFAK